MPIAKDSLPINRGGPQAFSALSTDMKELRAERRPLNSFDQLLQL
jgi:hypothetical protein